MPIVLELKLGNFFGKLLKIRIFRILFVKIRFVLYVRYLTEFFWKIRQELTPLREKPASLSIPSRLFLFPFLAFYQETFSNFLLLFPRRNYFKAYHWLSVDDNTKHLEWFKRCWLLFLLCWTCIIDWHMLADYWLSLIDIC